MDIIKSLFGLQDKTYKQFSEKLIPNIDKNTIIGVKTPKLKALAKTFNKSDVAIFFDNLPHKYLEQNHLHAYIISLDRDYDNTIKELDKFLPFVDNWATCDGLRPKAFKNNKDRLILDIKRYLASNHNWTIRFAIEMLMTHFLDDDFKAEYVEIVSRIKSDEYYVNMMIAWYFATALAKQYDSVIEYLTDNRLSVWVHNKSIQKSVESYRISDDKKEYLKTLKRK